MFFPQRLFCYQDNLKKIWTHTYIRHPYLGRICNSTQNVYKKRSLHFGSPAALLIASARAELDAIYASVIPAPTTRLQIIRQLIKEWKIVDEKAQQLLQN